MKVSVEISTYNRKDVLKLVLERLVNQTIPMSDFEVVISDDGSSDGLVDLVNEMAAELPYEIRVVGCERTGVGLTHNLGIEACRADLVVMLAADILPEPELLEEFIRSHEENPDPKLVVAGQILQSPDLPDLVFQQAFDSLLQKLFDDQLKGLHVPHFWISNISFKKEFMLEHGMFQNWRYAAGEDIELGYRMRDNGMVLIKNPKAVGYHYHEVTVESIALRSYSTGYHRHILEETVTDPEFLQKIGKPEQNMIGSALSGAKHFVRNCIENRFTVPKIVVPLIHLSEKFRSMAPVVPLLSQRMNSYYILRGIKDYKNGVPFDPFKAKIYPTDPG